MFDNYGDSNAPAAGESNPINVVNNPVPPVEPAPPNVVNSPVQPETSVPSWAQSTQQVSNPPIPPAPNSIFQAVPNLDEPELPPAPTPTAELPKQPQLQEPEMHPVQNPLTSAPTNTINQEGLEATARAVVKLYLDYRLKLALGQEPKLELWEETTKKFPDFAQKIHDLGEALKDAEKIKKEAFPEADSIIQRINFHNIEDEASRMLLTDILWRRATTNTGKFDREMSLPEEGVQMLREMGLSEDDADGELEISPREIVEKILSGKLRISPRLS